VSAREETLARYELVVGMEVHAQLNTRSKLFCGCQLEFGAPPNSRVCPVCLGHPGVLPVLNREAFAKCLRISVALGCDVPARTAFDRKNYYYPDLPKSYQISQMYRPLGRGGELQLLRSGKTVRLHDVHLEEDAGKLNHEGRGTSWVDLNRTGTPLAEIVTMPDFRSVEEVDDYMATLTELLRALDVCHCHMQEGNLRFEASVSVRPAGSSELGERTEIKNLNSYSAVRKAVVFEQARQIALLEAGKTPRQETRLCDEAWDPTKQRDAYEAGLTDEHVAPLEQVLALLPDTKDGWRGRTSFMRSKESAHDYRYFPEPDLPVIEIPASRVEAVRAALPELPGPRRERYVGLGLGQKQAVALVCDAGQAAYFEQLLALGVPAVDAGNYVLNQVQALLNELPAAAPRVSPVPPEHVAELHQVIAEGALPKDLVFKQVWPRTCEEGLSPREVIAKHGIEPVDASAVIAAVDQAWADKPKIVADILAGKKKARGAIVGAVMKATQGKADPQAINARIDELIAQAGE
jgi:aspartyl-tRNA(Asn)/glutamyl-tRNA(Gln) amidotransferase subunit B